MSMLCGATSNEAVMLDVVCFGCVSCSFLMFVCVPFTFRETKQAHIMSTSPSYVAVTVCIKKLRDLQGPGVQKKHVTTDVQP